MRSLHFAIACLLLFFGCGAVRYPLAPKKILLIDTSELSPQQRDVVKEAQDSWARQTRGCIQIIEGAGGVKITRMTPPDKYDEEDRRFVLGMYTPGHETIELAFSRFLDRDWAIIVAAHELGHALGLPHNEGQHSLMSANIYNAWLGLSIQDRIDLAKATGCGS